MALWQVEGDQRNHSPVGRPLRFWLASRAQTGFSRAALIAATSIFFMVIIASNARLASSPPAAIASISTRGVICHDTPHLSLHQPHTFSWPPLPTMAFQ